MICPVIIYSFVEHAKFVRINLLPKIHEHLHNVPGSPMVSNYRLSTDNLSSFLDYHYQPLAQRLNLTLRILKIGSKS